MHRSEARWKENTTQNFSKDSQFPSEIHSYKLLPQLYRDLFSISTDLNRFSTGSRFIVTSLLLVWCSALLCSELMLSCPLRLFDVGGQRSERKKWIHCLRTWPPLSSVWLWVDTTRCSMKTRPRWALNTHSHAETQTRTSVLMLWHTQTQLRTLSVCVSYTLKCANLTH